MKQMLIRRLPLMVFLYCVCQPVLDVVTYWQEELGVTNALTVVARMGLLCGSVLLGFILSDRKRYYWIAAGVLGGFLAARTWACLQAGYPDPFSDLSNMVRIYLLPLTTLCMCTFLRRNPRVMRGLRDGMMVNLVIIAAVMALSRITGTDPYTYPDKELGVRGWFYFANTQSAILSMIAPVAIGWALARWEKRILPVLAVTAVSLGVLYLLGTRLACAAFVAVGIGMTVCLLLIDRRRWRQSVAIGACTLVLTAMLPVSPMVKNQRQVAGNFEIKQAVFDAAAMTDDETATEEERQQRLIEAYDLFVPGLVSRFGGERTLEAYDYSTDVDTVGSWRLMRLTFCRLLLEDSPESARWFGMSRTRMWEEVIETDVLTGRTKQTITWFDPENDFHGIYYLCGAVGLALTIAYFAFFALRALYAMCRDFRRHFTVDFAAMAISCCCALAHCVFTASILRHNSGGVYLAMSMAALWQLSRREISAKRMHLD